MADTPLFAVRQRDDGQVPRRSVLSSSRRLREELEGELTGLTGAQRHLLDVLAFGDPLGRSEIRAVTTPADVRSLERRGLVSPRYDGRRFELRLANPAHRFALRDQVPMGSARHITRRLAETIEATGARREEDALRIATWRLISGGGHWEIMLAGAVAAFHRYDYALAERLARASLEATPNFHAAVLVARLASLQGRTDESELALARLAAEANDDTQRGLVALASIDNHVTLAGNDHDGILARAQAVIEDPGWRQVLEARRLALLLDDLGPRAASDETTRILERATTAGAIAFAAGAYSLGRRGRIDAAIDLATRGYAAQMASPTPVGDGPWWHMAMHCMALHHAGSLNEADALAADQHRAALTEHMTEAQAVFAFVRAAAVGERGRVMTAASRAREGLALSEQIGRPLITRSCHIYGSLALALSGRPHAAVESLAALDALALPRLLHDEVDLMQARAWTAASAGLLPQARRLLDEAAVLGDEIGDAVGTASALHGAARLGRAKDVLGRLKAVAGQIEGELARARVDHVEALAHQDAPGLEEASRTFEALGADLLAAEAAADASVVRQHAGEQRRAETARRRAQLLVNRCEGARTPALQAISIRGRLTPAQWETALMAASGQTSRQIADELCISRRTIENRLQQVYEQLGVCNRTALAHVLHLREHPQLSVAVNELAGLNLSGGSG